MGKCLVSEDQGEYGNLKTGNFTKEGVISCVRVRRRGVTGQGIEHWV